MSVSIQFEPDGKQIEIKQGMSVLEAARKARVSIRTRCEGKAGCLQCKVTIEADEGLIHSPTEAEQRKMGFFSTCGERLACQARIIGSSNGKVVVHVPEDPLKAAVRKRLLEQQEEDRLW
ncbi:2Fe-2S iron-sulfur cluster-binding protein [Paenibacillus agilis]|uniref:2Fe-2S iron-sulfur cluster binding domain-containing protein n=1 Tax=Paenibacillus agilis TaxID=3020863 RepID=A0A559IZ18_9BACL|nr:2Fe-2S iron-sulfur cluster-binding protein [Paenibacillus agilis]TVX92875.1 2Fe-2S iron-sulfur cluster binding domain-containing protein [Paenibacillus agilis]